MFLLAIALLFLSSIILSCFTNSSHHTTKLTACQLLNTLQLLLMVLFHVSASFYLFACWQSSMALHYAVLQCNVVIIQMLLETGVRDMWRQNGWDWCHLMNMIVCVLSAGQHGAALCGVAVQCGDHADTAGDMWRQNCGH